MEGMTQASATPITQTTPSTPPTLPPRPLPDGYPRVPKQSGGFPYGTALAAVIVIAASVAVLYFFSDAKVTVTPKSLSSPISATLTATGSNGDLPYRILVEEKVVGSTVPAESTETVNDAAQGKIVIANAQAAPQTLIKNTRFETSTGLIFRIHESVNIPAGSVSSPGTKEVTAYADAGGDTYNIGATSFTVPGLSGSKAFDLVTATSNGAMTGGFSGTRGAVTQATREAQNAKNRETLVKELQETLASKIPEGFVLVSGATFTNFEPANDTVGKDTMVTINQRGILTAIVFPEKTLAKAIATVLATTNTELPVSLRNYQELRLAPQKKEVPTEDTSFMVDLSGNVEIVWDVDSAKITGAVAGKTLDSARTVLQSFPEIDEFKLLVRPFWKKTFPTEPSDIDVEIEGDLKKGQ